MPLPRWALLTDPNHGEERDSAEGGVGVSLELKRIQNSRKGSTASLAIQILGFVEQSLGL